LVGADFTGADLTGTDLTTTNIQYAIFREVKGVDQESISRLQERAARGEYERQVFLMGLLNFVHTIAFFVSPALAIALGVYIRRRGKTPLQRRLSVAAICAVGVALISPLSLFILSFFGSNVAQFNAGNPSGYSAWSFWLRFWPLLMLGLVIVCLSSALVVIVCLVRAVLAFREWWQLCLCWCLTLLHCCLQYALAAKFFPTA
jgi:hypothetical protein